MCPIILLIIIVLVLAALAFPFLKRLIYFHPLKVDPLQEKYVLDKYPEIKSVQTKHLHGLYVKGHKPSKIVLFFHGNAGNVYSRIDKILTLSHLGYSVLIFDYSGYGKSLGSPSEETCYADAREMVEYTKKTYPNDEIILYGESLGGSIAAYAAKTYNIDALILESSLSSIKKVITSRLPPILHILASLCPEFDTENHLSSGYKGRILLLHSPTDEIIPYESMSMLKNICTKHISISGSHNEPVIPWSEITIFIDTIILPWKE